MEKLDAGEGEEEEEEKEGRRVGSNSIRNGARVEGSRGVRV